MSDLAPFIAAAGIRDRTVEQLLKENEKLQAKNETLQAELARRNDRMIQVTGPGGLPVYAEICVDEIIREEEENHNRFWGMTHYDLAVHMDPPPIEQVSACNFGDIKKAELRIGLQKALVLGHCDSIETDVDSKDSTAYSKYLFYNDDEEKRTSVGVEFGPVVPHHSGRDHDIVYEPRSQGIQFVKFTCVSVPHDFFD